MLKNLVDWLRGRKPSLPIEQQRITHNTDRFKTIASTHPEPHNDDTDPMVLAAMNRCLETGKPVFATRDKHGNCTIRDI